MTLNDLQLLFQPESNLQRSSRCQFDCIFVDPVPDIGLRTATECRGANLQSSTTGQPTLSASYKRSKLNT